MKRTLTTLLVALIGLTAPAGAVAAAPEIQVGATIVSGSAADLGFGVRAEYPLGKILPNLSVAGGLNLFFPRDPYDSWWEVNAAALYHFDVHDLLLPYLGAGLGFAQWRNQPPAAVADFAYLARDNNRDSSIALLVLAGCAFELDLGFTPFIEARLGIGGGNTLEVAAGVLVGF